jgi:hypothetical protein
MVRNEYFTMGLKEAAELRCNFNLNRRDCCVNKYSSFEKYKPIAYLL